jgi:uncharacterized FlaG/YvyC family protein
MEIGRINTAAAAVGAVDAALQSAARSPQQITQERELIKAVKAVDGTELFGHNSELTFVFDRETGRALVRVVDRMTREVVMQIPPEYVIRMAEERARG